MKNKKLTLIAAFGLLLCCSLTLNAELTTTTSVTKEEASKAWIKLMGYKEISTALPLAKRLTEKLTQILNDTKNSKTTGTSNQIGENEHKYTRIKNASENALNASEDALNKSAKYDDKLFPKNLEISLIKSLLSPAVGPKIMYELQKDDINDALRDINDQKKIIQDYASLQST